MGLNTRIAIIGAGISGLSVAYRLGQYVDTVVFEANRRLGGHTHTVEVRSSTGTTCVDTGFIVYNERNYPLFTGLLAELDVATQPSEMSFGVHDTGTGIEYSGSSLGTLFAQRRNALSPRYWVFLREILRFNRLSQALLSEAEDPDRTLQDFLDEHRFSVLFRNIYLLPMASAIWSTGEDRIGEFPLFAFVRFFANHGLIALSGRPQWRVLCGGSSRYVDALRRKLVAKIRAGTAVVSVTRSQHGVEVVDEQGMRDQFDAVVFACHSDQALRILGEQATQEERDVLGAIPYTESSVLLHTDERVLPARRAAWSAWNYWCDSASGVSRPAVTYSMNTLQRLDTPEHFLVTLNRDSAVRDDRVIRRLQYAHPLFTTRGLAAQRRHGDISGVNASYFCGAYWGYGFHEDGMASAGQVMQQLRKAYGLGA